MKVATDPSSLNPMMLALIVMIHRFYGTEIKFHRLFNISRHIFSLTTPSTRLSSYVVSAFAPIRLVLCISGKGKVPDLLSK